jgi:hypothetical protein
MESRAGGTADAGHHRDRREDSNDPQHEMSFGTCKRGIEALGGFRILWVVQEKLEGILKRLRWLGETVLGADLEILALSVVPCALVAALARRFQY